MTGAAAVLVAAPASGQGKTTVASALARLHARRGARVCAFKCGPDFLDPRWLALGSGAAVDSLDLWINGEADCARRLARAAQDADLVIVEGVMGLFDGQPSAADLAQRFALPVLAVIDASAMAGTFGAVAHGLRTWRERLPWAGVLANRVAGERHASMLRDAVGADAGWLGHLPRSDEVRLPERHLGLTMPAEQSDALQRLDAAADLLATTPLGQRALGDWPRWTAPVVPPAAPAARTLEGRRIAVACDPAFAFIYPANIELLRAMGAEIIFFSPLAGDALPACDALWLPGGYPELHAEPLAAHTKLRRQIHEHLQAGRPLWAECGGMMALADTLIDAQGRAHAMWGLLPGTVTLGRTLAALGPQQWRVGSDGLRGHTFHWSRFETPLSPATWTEASPATAAAAGEGEPLYHQGSLRAGWFHPWFASSPALTAMLFGGNRQ